MTSPPLPPSPFPPPPDDDDATTWRKRRRKSREEARTRTTRTTTMTMTSAPTEEEAAETVVVTATAVAATSPVAAAAVAVTASPPTSPSSSRRSTTTMKSDESGNRNRTTTSTTMSTSPGGTTKTKKKKVHPMQHFLAGGIAGFVESSCCHPLDTIKTRMQLLTTTTTTTMMAHQRNVVGGDTMMAGGNGRRMPGGTSSCGGPLVPPQLSSSFGILHPSTATAAATRPLSSGVSVPVVASSAVQVGPIGTARQILTQEGYVGLYRGLTAVYTGIIPKMSIRFVSFEYYRDHILMFLHNGSCNSGGGGRGTTTTMMTNNKKHYYYEATFMAGLASGITEAILVVTPAEVCKIRMQSSQMIMMSQQRSGTGRRKYTNVVQTALTIVREEGLMALYKGVVPTMLRQGCNQAVNFSFYNYFKRKWLDHQALQASNVRGGGGTTAGCPKNELMPWQHLLLGGISGGIGPLVNNPLDVVKTRMQKQVVVQSGGRHEVVAMAPKYRGLLQSCAVIATEEGVMSLWRGLTPRLLRIMPGQAITFMTYEAASRELQRRFGNM